MAFYEDNTSSSVYKCGLDVTVLSNSNTTSNEYVTVRLTPKLKHTQGARRYQHRWHIYFKVDSNPAKTYSYTGTLHNALPNSTSGTNVEGAGNMWMNAGQWYQWGDYYDVTVKNDGQKHIFRLYMNCEETIPRYCPAEGKWVEGSINTVGYKVTPPAPSGVNVTYDENTRTLSYTWDDAACSYILLYRNLFDSDGNIIPGKSSYVAPLGQNDKLYNSNKPFKEVVPEGTARVTYEMINVSASGHRTSSGHKEKSFATDNKVWINVPGVGWRKAIPWIKTPDGWKKATKTYVKVDNDWKRTIV